MNQDKRTFPVIDLHCDLLHYLATEKDAAPGNTEGIGCAIPYLKQGNVALQVMAISSVEPQPDHAVTESQIDWYKRLLADFGEVFAESLTDGKVGTVTAIENASSLCGDSDTLESGFDKLERIILECGRPLYISLTHHRENRFGGGNNAEAGLKDDGRELLDFIHGKNIAVDLSHTSDALARGILDHIEARGLNVPVIASHSNFRNVFEHCRNLTDDLARAVIERRGLIGINFLRAFMHPTDPDYLYRHIEYGLELGGEDVLALGADYFHTDSHPDPTRRPFYFEGHEHAGRYPDVLRTLSERVGEEITQKIAHGNARRFVGRS